MTALFSYGIYTVGYAMSRVSHMTGSRRKAREMALRRYAQQYADLKTEILDLGYVLQGSVSQRWMECGKPACHCHADSRARHGPYYQWSWKTQGRTSSIYLDKEQAALCKAWIQDNRRLERIIKRLRVLSLRVLRLHDIHRK